MYLVKKRVEAMALPGGNSSSGTTSTTQIQNSSSEGDLHQVLAIDERKRKRMQSNREAARRSRMRKQKHLDDLMAQVNTLRRENSQILSTINITTQKFLNVEAENSVLRAQMAELSQRLESLDEILFLMNSFNGDTGACNTYLESGAVAGGDMYMYSNNNSWNMNMNMNMGYLNQPIMASAADIFQY